LVTGALNSAMPSIRPTENTLRPIQPTMNRGIRLWIVAEERSISRLTKPSTRIARGGGADRADGIAGGAR
jgi:hypothetical protein